MMLKSNLLRYANTIPYPPLPSSLLFNRNEGMRSQSDEALLPDILDNLLVIERLSTHAVKLDQQFLSGSLSKLQLQLDPALELLLLDLEAIAIGDADLNN